MKYPHCNFFTKLYIAEAKVELRNTSTHKKFDTDTFGKKSRGKHNALNGKKGWTTFLPCASNPDFVVSKSWFCCSLSLFWYLMLLYSPKDMVTRVFSSSVAYSRKYSSKGPSCSTPPWVAAGWLSKNWGKKGLWLLPLVALALDYRNELTGPGFWLLPSVLVMLPTFKTLVILLPRSFIAYMSLCHLQMSLTLPLYYQISYFCLSMD